MSWFKTQVRKGNRVIKFEFDLANHMGLPNKSLGVGVGEGMWEIWENVVHFGAKGESACMGL